MVKIPVVLYKTLVIGVTILFVGVAVQPIVATTIPEIRINDKSEKTSYSNRYAILLEGVLYSQPTSYYLFLSAIQRMYWILTIKHGFKDNDIYVLSKHRNYEEPDFWDPNIIDYKSNKSNLEYVFNILKNKMKSEDLLFFYALTFGNGYDPSFSTACEKIYLPELESWINGTQGQLVIIFPQKGSNKYIPFISDKNIVIGASTNASHSTESWNEKYIQGLIGFSDSDPMIGNQDGIVSIEESHHYASRYLFNTSSIRWSKLDDNGDKKGHHYSDENNYNISDPLKDGYNASRTFLEGEITSNRPGIPLKPFGPTIGVPGVKYNYSTNSIDPDNDPMIYGFDWDNDFKVDYWSPLFDSGREVVIKHKFNELGTYEIQVKTRDIHWTNGDYSIPLTVQIVENFTNYPPEIINFSGPSVGKKGRNYYFKLLADDPENHELYFFIDWNDGTVERWIEPYSDGKKISIKHKWSNDGIYNVKAKVADDYGYDSEWVKMEIVISKDRAKSYFGYQWFFDRFPLLEVFLRAMNLLR